METQVKNNLGFMQRVVQDLGECSPMFAVKIVGNGNKNLIGIPIEQPEYKTHIAYLAGARVSFDIFKGEYEKVDSIYFMAESWYSKKPNIRPSEDKDRRECIVSFGRDMDGNNLMLMSEIKRNWNSITEKFGIEFVPVDMEAEPNDLEAPILDKFMEGYDQAKKMLNEMPSALKEKAHNQDKLFDIFLKAYSDATGFEGEFVIKN